VTLLFVEGVLVELVLGVNVGSLLLGFKVGSIMLGVEVGSLLLGFKVGSTLRGVEVGILLLGFKVGSLLAEEGLALGFLVLENVGDAVGIWEAVFPQAMPELQVYVDLTVRDLT
jgi:hypothetical protein